MVDVAELVANDRDAYELAQNMRSVNDGTSLGSILDRMQNRWNEGEKAKYLAAKNANTGHPFATYRGKKAVYDMVEFPRSEVSEELLRLYPWIDVNHPENVSYKFYQRQSDNLARALINNSYKRQATAKSYR